MEMRQKFCTYQELADSVGCSYQQIAKVHAKRIIELFGIDRKRYQKPVYYQSRLVNNTLMLHIQLIKKRTIHSNRQVRYE